MSADKTMHASKADGKGRFAPSPSGRMHLGNALSALLSWLSARAAGSEFIVRLEDLDTRCRKPEYADQLLDDLAWLGIDWDEDPLVQSRCLAPYEEAFRRLQDQGSVYPCFCSRADLHAASAPHASDGTPIYAGTCRGLGPEQVQAKAASKDPAYRLAVPETVVSFTDANMGECSQNLAAECGDFVVRRSDGIFAYQLVCVVDDALSGITQVVRGNDLLSSVARQIYLQKLLGLDTPQYAHHPLVVASDGRRLSKRDRDCDLGRIRAEVRHPEEVVGLLARMAGLSERGDGDMSASELVSCFIWDKVPTGDICIDDFALPCML